MAPPAPLGFKTFAPGKAPSGREGDALKLKPGQTVHWKPGSGYYAVDAAPAPVRRAAPAAPAAPVFNPQMGALTRTQISTQAGTLAQAGLTPQQDEIRRQQALAAEQAKAEQGAIQGFSTAAGGILQGIAPQVGAGYQDAAREQGALGQGMATQVQGDLAAKNAQDVAFAESQGQQTAPTTDPNAAHDVLYGLNGQIPASTLSESGAAAQALAAETAALPLDAGREQLDASMATARQTNDHYAQQLIQLAAQFPGLKAQAIQQLNQYELDKANYRLSVTNTSADNRRQDAALAAQKQAAGLTSQAKTAEMNYKWASLSFQTQKAANSAKAASAKGKTIDVSASKLLGHLVYKDGSEDPSIKVKQTASSNPQQKAQVNRAKATSAARKGGFDYATKLRGTPTPNTEKGLLKGKGKYIADPKVKGTFPPGKPGGPRTTNNPALALRDRAGAADYQDAQMKVWAEIDGDGLMSRYGYSRQAVLSLVNQALVRAGWKKR